MNRNVPLPVVAVEVAPPPARGASTVLLDTCSSAVRRGRCELSREDATEEPPAAIAIVSWIGDGLRHARVQVGVRREVQATWATRDVYFEAADPELERWRSVGLTIAILIGELPETRALMAAPEDAAPSPEPAASVTPAPASAAPASSTPATSAVPPADHAAPAIPPAPASSAAPASRGGGGGALPKGFVGALVTYGTGLDRGPWRRGGTLWAARSLSPLPLWIPVSVEYAWRPREDSLKADWLTLRAGVANVWPLAGQRLALEAELFLALEQLTATATNATTGRQDSAQRWAPLVGVGLGPILRVLPALGIGLEARFAKSLRTFTLYNAGEVVAESASWTTAIQVGPLLTFP
jgi:hypothetical protein